LVKTAATACKVTGPSAAISCFFTAFYEITAAETAFRSTFAARPTSQRFMVVEHHNAKALMHPAPERACDQQRLRLQCRLLSRPSWSL
jgi:hypothetical protein